MCLSLIVIVMKPVTTAVMSDCNVKAREINEKLRALNATMRLGE